MNYRLELRLEQKVGYCTEKEKIIFSPTFDFPNPLREGETLSLGRDEYVNIEGLDHIPKKGYTLIRARIVAQESDIKRRFNNWVKKYQNLINKL